MTLTDHKETCLANNPLFKELPKDKLVELAKGAQYLVFPPNTIIFREGDPGDSFYMINRGRVRLSKKSKRGEEILLAKLGAGDFFGQLAILTDDFRWVNVETMDETHLTVLSKDQFDGILKEWPSVSFAFAKQMSKYLARNIQVIKQKSERRLQVSRSSWIDWFVIFSVSLLCGIIFNNSNPNGIRLIPNIVAEKDVLEIETTVAAEKHKTGDAVFVDARPSTLYDMMHIEGAVNMPLALFDIMYMMGFSDMNKKKGVIVYGRTFSSNYDEQVAKKLYIRGHKHTMILKGGIELWMENGYPVKP